MMSTDILDTIEHGSRVQQFYSGQSIFVTGGTGFLGKLLVEKLLWSCDVKVIYLMVRPKKGEGPTERLERLFKSSAFDRIKKEVPENLKKVQLIGGDYSLPGLGMSPSDVSTLTEQVTLVFNVAATVRFNEPLKQAITINIKGTRDMLELCCKMKRLQAVIHVSTAYSHCDRKYIEEKLYNSPISAQEALLLLENSNDEAIERQERNIHPFPNTYAYTKCIGEDLVRQYGKILNIGVFRPAIVSSSYNEPAPGWTDNLLGTSAGVAAGAIGALRTCWVYEEYKVDLIPADYSTNALIATAWAQASQGKAGGEPIVYNYTVTSKSRITWGDYLGMMKLHGNRIPTSRAIWYTSALSLYKKIYTYARHVTFFTTNEWEFGTDNVTKLWESLDEKDQKLFPFSFKHFNWFDYLNIYIHGIRLFMFKEDPSTIPYARKKMFVLMIIHYIVKYSMMFGLFCLFYRALF